MPAPVLPHDFHDGPGNLASGEEVMDNFNALLAGLSNITNEQINDGTIGAAELANGAVTPAKKAAAVAATYASAGAISITSGANVPFVTVSPTVSGVRPVLVVQSGFINNSSGADQDFDFQLVRDGSWVVGRTRCRVTNTKQGPLSIVGVDLAPAAGVRTYTLYCTAMGDGSGSTSVADVRLFAVEL